MPIFANDRRFFRMLDSGEFRVKLNPDRTSFVKATPPDPDCTSSPLSGSFKWHFDIDEAKINVFSGPKLNFHPLWKAKTVPRSVSGPLVVWVF